MGAKVAVIGDLILDEYVVGAPERISPEAPVPVARVEGRDFRLGGGANVAANVVALGGEVCLAGVVGDDREGKVLRDMARDLGIRVDGVVVDASRPTTLKTRVVALPTRQQLLRLDREARAAVAREILVEMLDSLEGKGPFSCFLLSDYRKGVVSRYLVKEMKRRWPRVPVLVDPKGEDYSLYEGAYLVKPNKREALALGRTVEEGVEEIFRTTRCSWVVVTLGAQGMSLFSREGLRKDYPARAREVYDVTGAGDTVFAALGVFLGEGLEMEEAVFMANVAAGLAVEKVGTAVVTREEVERALVGRGKVFSVGVLKGILEGLKAQGKRIVFTNGCFDVLHPGHLDLLRRARAEGDVLVVAINSDDSVRRLKGQNRPIFSQEERAMLLAGLEFVDFVTFFEEDTPYEVISLLRPHVLVKGRDYRLEEVVGRDLVEEVVLVPLKEGYSTTRLIERIKNAGLH